MAIEGRTGGFLAEHGLPDVVIEHAAELPSIDARTGKFRQVWSAQNTRE
ncbi:hypothetical protein [Mycolicibacterium duvalii]|nr:hypothetical protein [Mycolicibacterium duvalii]MCV7369468.1 hypothetical protein [Mycolicibacterium duvalii]